MGRKRTVFRDPWRPGRRGRVTTRKAFLKVMRRKYRQEWDCGVQQGSLRWAVAQHRAALDFMPVVQLDPSASDRCPS